MSAKSIRKDRRPSKSPDRKRERVPRRGLVPGKDYPMYVDPDPQIVRPGVAWAEEHGYGHVDRLSEQDAHTVLAVLKMSEQDAFDAFGAMIFGNPWCWLEAYAKAGGDFESLHVHCIK